ncbi:MAG: GntR family transcriptional regulator [Phenylobacterium sp.]|nr:GntR family transcriptional regulator [Phenylobacterium sp.]
MLAREDGAYLGSTDDLMQMLGIGRVTLQQTARILEQERLLRVKRGVNGGYYGTRPDEGGVEQNIAIYLRAKNSGFREALQVVGALSGELLRLAAQSNDEALREELRQIGERIEDPRALSDGHYLVEMERIFYDAIFKLAANPLGELIVRVTFRLYFDRLGPTALDGASGAREWQRTRARMVRGVLERDGDYLELISRKFNRALQDNLSKTDR